MTYTGQRHRVFTLEKGRGTLVLVVSVGTTPEGRATWTRTVGVGTGVGTGPDPYWRPFSESSPDPDFLFVGKLPLRLTPSHSPH